LGDIYKPNVLFYVPTKSCENFLIIKHINFNLLKIIRKFMNRLADWYDFNEHKNNRNTY